MTTIIESEASEVRIGPVICQLDHDAIEFARQRGLCEPVVELLDGNVAVVDLAGQRARERPRDPALRRACGVARAETARAVGEARADPLAPRDAAGAFVPPA